MIPATKKEVLNLFQNKFQINKLHLNYFSRETGIVRPHVLTPNFQFALPPVLLITLHVGGQQVPSRTCRDKTDVRKGHAVFYETPKKGVSKNRETPQNGWFIINGKPY